MAAHVHPAQAVVMNQVSKNGLDGTLAHPAHPLPEAALLALPRPAVRPTVNGTGELFDRALRDARGFERALLTLVVGDPVELDPTAVGGRVHFFKVQALARRALVGVRLDVVGKAVDLGLVLAK